VSSTRRAFLKTSTLAATGIVIGVELSEGLVGKTAVGFEPNAYIRISPDNIVRLWITRSEMGQGVRTTLSMMLAEELEMN
jgi:isoquinoline 1-oxidoreductase subunit beta